MFTGCHFFVMEVVTKSKPKLCTFSVSSKNSLIRALWGGNSSNVGYTGKRCLYPGPRLWWKKRPVGTKCALPVTVTHALCHVCGLAKCSDPSISHHQHTDRLSFYCLENVPPHSMLRLLYNYATDPNPE